MTVTYEGHAINFAYAAARKVEKYNCLKIELTAEGFVASVHAFVMGAMGSWNPENDKFLKIMGLKRSLRRQLAGNCVIHSIIWTKYVFFTWLSGARYQNEPEEAEEQRHWLMRALTEDEELAREWVEMGRSLPNPSEIPPRRKKKVAHLTSASQPAGSSRFLWLSQQPTALVGEPEPQIAGRGGGAEKQTARQQESELAAAAGNEAGASTGAREEEEGGAADGENRAAAAEKPPDLRSISLGDFVPRTLLHAQRGCYNDYSISPNYSLAKARRFASQRR